MTLTQLSAFVLVARLGSVKAAASALGVSEPAVSQALAALRQHLGDPLIVRGASGMTLTAGGSRLLTIASQMVALGAEAEAAVRAAQGAPSSCGVVATSTIAEFVAAPLLDAFSRRTAGRGRGDRAGWPAAAEMPVLVANRLADVALGPHLGGAASAGAGQRADLPVPGSSVVGVRAGRPRWRRAAAWPWLVDPSGTDPAAATRAGCCAGCACRSRGSSVFPNQTAAWAAAADGAGVAPALGPPGRAPAAPRRAGASSRRRPRRWRPAGTPPTLPPDRRSAAAGSLRHFLGTPEAMQLMRAPGAGVPPSRFRPPVYVTIWS